MAQSPQVDVIAGIFQAGTYFVQTAWLNARGEEGMASAVMSAAVLDQNSLQVTAQGAPANATVWNVYAGTSIDAITLQIRRRSRLVSRGSYPPPVWFPDGDQALGKRQTTTACCRDTYREGRRNG